LQLSVSSAPDTAARRWGSLSCPPNCFNPASTATRTVPPRQVGHGSGASGLVFTSAPASMIPLSWIAVSVQALTLSMTTRASAALARSTASNASGSSSNNLDSVFITTLPVLATAST
jgi:hypothetical protein